MLVKKILFFHDVTTICSSFNPCCSCLSTVLPLLTTMGKGMGQGTLRLGADIGDWLVQNGALSQDDYTPEPGTLATRAHVALLEGLTTLPSLLPTASFLPSLQPPKPSSWMPGPLALLSPGPTSCVCWTRCRTHLRMT